MFDTIKVAVAYKDTSSGETFDSFPEDLTVLERCEVVYESMNGWKGQSPVAGVKNYDNLPAAARSYVDFIEAKLGVRVKYIGTGPAREDMIVR